MKKFEEIPQSVQDVIYDVYKCYKAYYDVWNSATDEGVEYGALSIFVDAEDEIVAILNRFLDENKEALYEFEDAQKALYDRWLNDPDYYKYSRQVF